MRTSTALAAALGLLAGCSLMNDPTKLEPGPDTAGPAAPTGFAATPGISKMGLSWSANTDWDLDHYVVYYAPTGDSLMKHGTTSATAYEVPALDNGTVYDFMVLAVDRFGNVSGPSDTLTAQPDGVAPTVAFSLNPLASLGSASRATDVIVTFDEIMDTASVEAAATVSGGSTVPACVWTWYADGAEAKCDFVVGGDPATQLDASTSYTLAIGTGAKDRAGNALAGAAAVTFTTVALPDTDPPGFVSATVTNYQSAAQAVGTGSPGAQGVFPDTNVVITFDEPMDTTSTGGAVSVNAGPGYNGGQPRWNTEGTVLTFDPDVNYPAGTLVTVAIGAGAKDGAGNPLPAFTSRTFRVAYSATATLSSEAAIDGYGYSTGTSTDVYPSSSFLLVGDSASNGQYKGFVSFSRAALPATLTRFTAATLSVYQYSVSGTPYDDLDALRYCFYNPFLGTLVCYYDDLLAAHVNLGTSLDAGDFTAGLLTGAYEISTSAALGTKSANVLTAVEDDRVSGRSRSQWRLEFPTATDGGGDFDGAYSTPPRGRGRSRP
jgi:hypothetical protein